LEKRVTKDILKSELYSGQQPAAEFLYTRYGGMLFSYVLQFVPDRTEAGNLLADIFYRLTPRLQQAFESSLSIYCWLQVEARKIIVEYLQSVGDGHASGIGLLPFGKDPRESHYFSLLQGASTEHQWVFRELFIYGREREDLAMRSGRELSDIDWLLRECLLIIRKNLVRMTVCPPGDPAIGDQAK
jgi:DNA-directed RNA polymerase specialized sigma24 family protein